jgi:hypothetical protein
MRNRIMAALAALAVALGMAATPAYAAPRPAPAPSIAVQDKADPAAPSSVTPSGKAVKAPRNGHGGRAPGGGLVRSGGAHTLLFPSGYMYVYAQQGFAGTDFATGVSGSLYMSQPYVDTTSAPSDKDHSLFELSADDNSGNIVEIGWAAEPTAFGDTKPRLFAGSWVSGVWSGCYGEGCGWVDATPGNSADDLGRDLTSFATATFPGQVKNFQFYNATNQCGSDATGGWWFFFNGAAIGCLPNILWGGAFKKVKLSQGFGEIYSNSVFCSDLGNGKQGSSVVAPIDASDPAYIGSLANIGMSPGTLTNNFNLFQTNSAVYSYGTVGSVGNRTFTVGGQGYTSTGTTPGNLGSC